MTDQTTDKTDDIVDRVIRALDARQKRATAADVEEGRREARRRVEARKPKG